MPDHELLIKLINGQPILDKDIEEGLTDMCDRLHAGDCHICLMRDLGFNSGWPCGYHKNGKKMLQAIRDTQKVQKAFYHEACKACSYNDGHDPSACYYAGCREQREKASKATSKPSMQVCERVVSVRRGRSLKRSG